MRLFFALPMPETVGSQLAEAGRALKKRFHSLAVPREQGMHVTLFFFGETAASEMPALARLLASSELARPAIKARFRGADTFPPQGNPKVIYAGFGEGEGDILDLWRTLHRLLDDLHWPLEEEKRPFRAHVTIARNKQDRIDRKDIEGIVLPAEPFLIDRCVLFQSVLKFDGAVYTSLAERRFGG
jgi:2'-5' RNA ligase